MPLGFGTVRERRVILPSNVKGRVLAPEVDTAVLLTHKLPKTAAETIRKYENLALKTKNIWNLYNVSAYPSVISAEGVVSKNFLKYVGNIG